MNSWRERIAEARQRGTFTDRDRDDTSSFRCAAAEVAGQYGYRNLRECPSEWLSLWDIGHGFAKAVRANQPTEAERFLDAIEDRAFQLKREQAG